MGDSSFDDKLIASRIRKGDRDAFAQFFNRYKKIVYFFSLRYLGDPSEAEEMVQIVFISIWEHRGSIDISRSLRSYLFRSVVNTIYNSLKKRAVRRAYLIKEMNKPEGASNPYDQIFYNDFEERLTEIIGTLPPQQQVIVNFRRNEGLSHEEIAGRLNLSVRTVENQLYRVNKILRNTFRSEIKS